MSQSINLYKQLAKHKLFNKSVNFNLYTREMMAHGFLHLIGYDHNNKKNHSIMIKKQLDLLTL